MSGQFWDERFRGDAYMYGEKPNAFLEHRHTLIPKDSKALVLGDGEGRNGVFLARKRCQVTSVDESKVGLEKAQALAKRHGVELTTIQATLPNVDIELGVWDAVVLIYLHMPEEARRATHKLAVDALKPGGLLILEAFTPAQLEYSSGGPKDEAMLYTAEMLREDFAGMEFEAVAELETVLDEGPGHQGRAQVVRVLAVKA